MEFTLITRQGKSLPVLKDEEDDDEILALNEQIAAYNHDSFLDYVEGNFLCLKFPKSTWCYHNCTNRWYRIVREICDYSSNTITFVVFRKYSKELI